MTDQLETRAFCLINGTFTPDEAGAVLMQLLEHKINFHRSNNWSHKERFSLADPDSETRIEELTRTKAELSGLLHGMAEAGSHVTIRCDIDIAPAAR